MSETLQSRIVSTLSFFKIINYHYERLTTIILLTLTFIEKSTRESLYIFHTIKVSSGENRLVLYVYIMRERDFLMVFSVERYQVSPL